MDSSCGLSKGKQKWQTKTLKGSGFITSKKAQTETSQTIKAKKYLSCITETFTEYAITLLKLNSQIKTSNNTYILRISRKYVSKEQTLPNDVAKEKRRMREEEHHESTTWGFQTFLFLGRLLRPVAIRDQHSVPYGKLL